MTHQPLIRINVVAEGQSEMYFAKMILNEYFAETFGNRSISADARCVLTSKDNRTNNETRGGLTKYSHAKNDIVLWSKEDRNAYITTMFDFFRIPNDFPGYSEAMKLSEPIAQVRYLEEALKNDILQSLPEMAPDRFIPYIQLHEFEALLYTDLNSLKLDYFEPDDVKGIDSLIAETRGMQPEEINHGAETAPSKRLIKAIGYRKGANVVEIMRCIPMEQLRRKCPHFSGWIDAMLSL